MACKNVCRLCPRLIISQAVTFADGTLTVNIPAGSYANGEKYCIVVAQTRPATTTIDAPVVITIGAGTETYPLTGCKNRQHKGRRQDEHDVDGCRQARSRPKDI